MSPALAKVVIIGGGFAGLAAARALARAPVSVTLVDRTNHHLFQPLLYQVAMAGLAPSEIAAPIRSVLRHQQNVRVLLAEATAIDLERRRISLAQASDLEYDHLILAPGALTSYFGHYAWAAHAPGLKTLDDAVEIRRRVLLAFEAAERAQTAEERARLVSFVVIGGGPTGVELAGAIAELARHVLSRDFRSVHPEETRVLLLEGGERVLPAFDPDLSASAVLQLSELGVHVRTGTLVEEVSASGVLLHGGEQVAASTVLWAAGVVASPLIGLLGIETDRAGRALVQPDCSIPGHSEVFVVGDATSFRQHDRVLPGVSPVALQMGRHVGRMIHRDLAGKPRKPFRYVDKGSMATIGRSRAVAQLGNLRLSGHLAWLAWLLVHVWYLIDFRNRLLVAIDWGWSYFTYRRGARLITGGRMDPGAPS